jgi:hypothetical protein
LVVDQLNLEKLGIPTVTIVTEPFVNLAKQISRSEGIPELCFVIIPHPVGALPPDEVVAKADNAFPNISFSLTGWQPPLAEGDNRRAYPAERFEFTGSVEEINRVFFKKRWSSGLPIIPPTVDLVHEMISKANLKPDEVIGVVPPRYGILTVELVVAHAVMAGCRPEYMRLLIAILRALLAQEVDWRGSLTTTGTTQIVIVVNGPIVKELGIGYKQGAAGKGYHPNTSIGYAINLIAYNIGGSRSPDIDRSTLASPGDFVCWMFGENEEKLPAGWEPFHVENGFRKDESVVTVMNSYPPIENIDHNSISPQEHMRWWAHLVNGLHNMGGPVLPVLLEQHPIIALGPEHAQIFAQAGWTKDDYRRAFWEGTRLPLSVWPSSCKNEKLLEQYLGPVTPESLIPITVKPEQLHIVIAGGEGKHSHYFAPFPGAFSASKAVI